MKKTVLFLSVVFLTVSTQLSARDWTDVASGRTIEADYVESDSTHVVVKAKDQTYTFAIAGLSEADRIYIQQQADKSRGPLSKTTPSGTKVKITPIRGNGDDRSCSFELTNGSGKEIKRFVARLSFLKPDGSAGKTLPKHFMVTIESGESKTFEVDSFFMEDDTSSVDVLVKSITFEDNSTWPAIPKTPPARKGMEPVAAKIMGVIGDGRNASLATVAHNYGEKPIRKIFLTVVFVDGNDEKIGYSNQLFYRGEADKDALASEQASVITGGPGPPSGAADARVYVRSVTFTDGTKWRAPR